MLWDMPSDEVPPHQTVEVGFTNNDYVNVCDTYGGGHKLLDKWRALGDLLAHRPGWHFDVVNRGEALWSLGAFGESLLNIHVQENGTFGCLDYIQDKRGTGDGEAWFEARTVDEVEAWLDKREAQSRQPSELAKQLLSDEDWRILRIHEFKVKVTWSDGWYLADVRGIPEEATFEKTLHDLIASTRAMITRYVDAPADLASDLRVRVELDDRSANKFAEQGK